MLLYAFWMFGMPYVLFAVYVVGHYILQAVMPTVIVVIGIMLILSSVGIVYVKQKRKGLINILEVFSFLWKVIMFFVVKLPRKIYKAFYKWLTPDLSPTAAGIWSVIFTIMVMIII